MTTGTIGKTCPTLSASDMGLCILFQTINSGQLSCIQQPYGGSWSSVQDTIYKTLSSPALIHISLYKNQVIRRLLKEEKGLPTLPLYLGPDAKYNWDNKPNEPQLYWGFTGIVCIKDTHTGLRAGAVIIFPGTHSPNGPGIKPYQGTAHANGVKKDALIKGDVNQNKYTSVHLQLCKLYMKDGASNTDLEEYRKHFIGFALTDLDHRDKIVFPPYTPQFISNQLNSDCFGAASMSKEWQSLLGEFCKKNFATKS